MRKFDAEKLQQCLNDPCVNMGGIAKRAGISYHGLKKIKEKGSIPSANTLVAIADALNKPLEYFFADEKCNYSDNGDKNSVAS